MNLERAGALRGRSGKENLMARRTRESDGADIRDAADLDDLVKDKRSSWRASAAKARRRQRRYQKRLTGVAVARLAAADPED